jgi:hypothetical protein
MRIECGKECWSLWVGECCLTANYCPSWPQGRFTFHENGGRKRGECLDLNLTIGRVIFSIVWFNLRWLPALLRFVPTKPKSGFSFGFFPSSER